MSARIQVLITDGPAELPERSPVPGVGAECVFRGVTRGETHPHLGALEALEYEVHEPMAVRMLDELASEVLVEFKVDSVRIAHARGRVTVGEASVLIEVRSPHRADAFNACRAVIDRLKERIPIFKLECWERGTTRPEGMTPQPR